MKEPSIEEKAARYDEAIEVIKSNYATIVEMDEKCTFARSVIINTFHHMFPELKESGDDKIRNAIVKVITNLDGGFPFEKYGIKKKDALAWLEKQGEQTPADKAEPEFKVGDWIVKNDGKDCFSDGSYVLQITGIYCNKYYDISNGCCLMEPFTNTYRLWTIQDAKDGDVLANKYGAIFINDGNRGGRRTLDCYCYLSLQNEFCVERHKTGSWLYKDDIKPATKKQCDILFQKMNEAGYEWNAEKKELKKIEPKPAIEQETPEENLGIDSAAYNKIVDECVYGEQKSAWSEDDVNRLRNLIYLVEHSDEGKGTKRGFIEFINRLKSLKGKEQLNWKPSNEQMKQLKSAANIYPDSRLGYGLKTLYEDLKKLMEA